MRFILLAPSVVSAAVIALGGCAHTRDSEAHSRAAQHIYEAPIEDVWPKVRQAMIDDGFSIREDVGNFALETERKEHFSASKVAGVWTSYLVLGDSLGRTRCKVRVFKSQRMADKTMEKTQSDVSWGIRSDIGASQGGEDDQGEVRVGGAAKPASLEEMSDQLDTPDGQMRALAPGRTAMRDLQMEWKLVQTIEPQLAEQLARSTPHPRAVHSGKTISVSLPGLPAADCGVSIPGVTRLMRPGALVMLGEVHGTREVPKFVGDASCQAALTETPVSVGLQIPEDERDFVTAYLNSEGTPQDMAELVDSLFWVRPYQDGRSSVAMAELIERLRQLRSHGLDVLVFLYDHSGVQGEEREQAMAETIEAEVRNHPERAFLVLSGNVHNRRVAGVQWDPKYVPMGVRLSRKLKDVTSLDMAYASGTAWICALKPKLDCGVRPAEGKDNGTRPFIHLWSRLNKGYDGVFYVGAVSASPPAHVAGVTSGDEIRPSP